MTSTQAQVPEQYRAEDPSERTTPCQIRGPLDQFRVVGDWGQLGCDYGIYLNDAGEPVMLPTLSFIDWLAEGNAIPSVVLGPDGFIVTIPRNTRLQPLPAGTEAVPIVQLRAWRFGGLCTKEVWSAA